MLNRLLFLLLLVSLLLAACQPNEQPSEAQSVPPVMPHSADIPDDFLEFYRNFHHDQEYQLNHIIFPLKGLPQDADSATIVNDNYFYEKESWTYHKPYDYETGDFTRKFVRYTDELIAEHILHRKNGLGILRRYAKLGDEWFLIYYAALNNIEPAKE